MVGQSFRALCGTQLRWPLLGHGYGLVINDDTTRLVESMPVLKARATARCYSTRRLGRGYLLCMGREHIGRLQALRFFASFGVLIAHIQHEVHSRLTGPSDMLSTFPFMIGVDVFFVISGFVIWHISVDEFGKPKAPAHFLLRRIIRVVPLYWIATTLVLLIAVGSSGVVNTTIESPAQVLSSYLFIPHGDFIPVLKLGWTLNYEMLFYAIFAVGLVFRRAVGLAAIFGFLALLVILATIFPHVGPLDFWGDSVVLTFLCGIGLSIALRGGSSIPMWFGAVLIAVGFVVAYFIHAGGYTEENAPRFFCLGIPAVLMSAGVILYRPKDEPGPIMRGLERVGDSSYSLYLSHMFSIRGAFLVFHHFRLTDPWLFAVVAMVVALGAAILVREYVERPVTDLLRRRLNRDAAHVR